MTNFYITDDYKLRKMMGYKSFYRFTHTETKEQDGEEVEVEVEDPVDAIYPVKLNNTEYLLAAANQKLYYFLKSDLDGEWNYEEPAPEPDNTLTEEWKVVSTLPYDTYGEGCKLTTYAKLVSQDKVEKVTHYQVKAVFYATTEIHVGGMIQPFIVVDGVPLYGEWWDFYQGETTILDRELEISHPSDGSSFTHDMTTRMGGSEITATVTIPHIDFGPEAHVIPEYLGDLGTGKVSFFTFDKKVYVLSGKYQSWDGNPLHSLQRVEGYTPLVFINTPPSGGGLIYDEINMLSPNKHQTFNGDGTSTTYYLAQNNEVVGRDLDSIYRVLINGTYISPSEYTVSLTQGTVTFDTAPPVGMDNVDIYWSVDDGDRHIIENMQFGTIFGGDVDTRVFVYGNPEFPNRTYFSGIADDGTNVAPSVEYFPATAQVDIGPSNFALTDLTRQYDRLLATTNKPEAYYLTISTEQLPVTLVDNSQTTRYVPAVSTFPLNEAHGNMAMGQGQLIDNYPVTMDKTGLSLWKATNVRDEKNMEDISQRISQDLNDMDMASIKMMDFQSSKQLWFGSGNKIYIYNYYNKTFSRIILPDFFTCYTELGKNVYMGLEDGRVARWDRTFKNFDGKKIDSHWEMNYSDFGAMYLRKTMRKVWILMQPQGHSSATIGFITNSKESNIKKRIEYLVQDFDNIDFSDFSFQLSYNTKPYKLKMKAKKFTNLKLTIDNAEETDCTILQVAMSVESFGESK